jgi:hypothetical protein
MHAMYQRKGTLLRHLLHEIRNFPYSVKAVNTSSKKSHFYQYNEFYWTFTKRKKLVACYYISIYTWTTNLTRMRSEIIGNYINFFLPTMPFSNTVVFPSSISHAENCTGMSIRTFRNIVLLLKTFTCSSSKPT